MTTHSSPITRQPNHGGLRIYLNSKQGQKLLGLIVRDTLRVFKTQRHYHRSLQGYGVNSEVLRDHNRFRFSWIELTIEHADGRKERHRITRDKWQTQGIRWMHFQYACESQYILPLAIIRGEASASQAREVVSPSKPIQPSLFAEALP